MICSSGIGFDPVHEGHHLTFGFHGIWQGTAVLYDKQTDSLWLHITGECIDGPLEGAVLEPIAGRHVQWREWKRDHPKSRVMAPQERFRKHYFPTAGARRGVDMFPPMFPPTIQRKDARLGPSDLLYGIRAGGVSRAYPLEKLRESGQRVVNDTLGKVPVVVLYDPATGSAAAHGRALDGKTLTLEWTEQGLRDQASGSHFDHDGRATDGPLQGKRLPALMGLQSEWYGWFAAHPDTTIWRP